MKTLIAVTLLLCSQATLGAEAIEPTGVYRTVSESEWQMELRLDKDHSATLKTSMWAPGEGDHPKVDTLKGNWHMQGDKVATTFKKYSLYFTFDSHLSFDDFGQQGAAQGLVGASGSIDNDNFEGRHFWLKSELAKIKWP